MASSRNCRFDIPSFRVARSISLSVASSSRVEKILCIRKQYNVSKGPPSGLLEWAGFMGYRSPLETSLATQLEEFLPAEALAEVGDDLPADVPLIPLMLSRSLSPKQ